MTIDDPKLTAYVLDELSASERCQIEKEIQSNPLIAAEVKSLQSIGGFLESSFAPDTLYHLTSDQRQMARLGAVPMPDKIVPMKRESAWMRGLVAISAAAACISFAMYLLNQVEMDQPRSSASSTSWKEIDVRIGLAPMPAPVWGETVSERGTQLEDDSPVATKSKDSSDTDDEFSDPLSEEEEAQVLFAMRKNATNKTLPDEKLLPELKENAFLVASQQSETEVPVLSGKASYPWVRRYLDLESGLPPKNAVRIEELINAFPYNEPRDTSVGRVAAGMRLVSCPWDENSWLLGVLLRNTSSVDDIEVKARLFVKSVAVSEYRLLGFAQPEKPISGLQIPRHLPAGESQFVIYELKKKKGVNLDSTRQLANLSIRSRLPGRSWDVAKLSCKVEDRSWLSESNDFRFAALMSGFGQALRNDDLNREAALARVSYLAGEIVSSNAPLTVPQKEAVQLIRRASRLAKEKR